MAWSLVWVFFFTNMYLCFAKDITECPCPDKKLCDPIDDWKNTKREVFAMTNRSNDYQSWNWDSITTVVQLKDWLHPELFCYAHSKGKKYGIQEVLDMERIFTELKPDNTTRNGSSSRRPAPAVVPPNNTNTTEDPLDVYINETLQSVAIHRADVILFDLIKYLGNCDYAKEHEDDIITNTTKIINGFKNGLKPITIVCVLPWKPPCFDADCNLGPKLADLCDGVILSPDSYFSYCDSSCIAKATAPFSKMVTGLNDYLATGFDISQMMIGVPWHGYKYTCVDKQYVPGATGHYVCKLARGLDKSNNSVCLVDKDRERVNYGNFMAEHPAWLVDGTRNYSPVDQARWRVDTELRNGTNTTVMYWYEDVGSLTAKYNAVHDFNLKGMAIYLADDLSNTKVPAHDDAEASEHMWSWVLHTILSAGPVQTKDTSFNYAGTVAGVGVGMFLFGCLLGTLISCIVFRRNRKLRPPFHKDSFADEFHDDDNAL